MEYLKKYWVVVGTVLLILLFLWSRFVNLSSTMFFINDMGRDMLVLRDWIDSGKPPLLGPQTSAMPINQSAIFFYMLMPAFLILKGSPLTLFYTHSLVYVLVLVAGIWFLRKKPVLQGGLLTGFFLMILNPQYITQSRFIVWNPSFVTPFLGVALVSLYLLSEKYTLRRLMFFVFSLAMAISVSYSVAPAFISIFIYIFLVWRKNRIKTILAQIVALGLVNLPTILFEIKHKFVLTSSLLSRGAMPQKASDITLVTKFNSLFGYALSIQGWLLVVCVLALFALIFWYSLKKENKQLKFFSSLLALTVVITLLVPMTIHTHYIFGFTTLLFLSIAFLPRIPRVTVLTVFCVAWIGTIFSSDWFKPASRTYPQMMSCFSQVCRDIKEPIFVSVQADFHPYHNGPEHRYMMKQSGCKVKYIEEEPNSASLMAVVLDDSEFELGKTAYNELTTFGEAREIKRYDCQSNFGVVILSNQ